MLASTCETRPDTSFAQHWLEREEFRIPLDHECFDDLASFFWGILGHYSTPLNGYLPHWDGAHPIRDCRRVQKPYKGVSLSVVMVPAPGIEPGTCGLQNRCSTN